MQPSRLTAGCHHPSLAARRQPSMPSAARRGTVGDRARDEEADRPAPIGSPDEPVVVGARQRDMHRLIGRDVEEQRPGGLDDRGPPRRTSADLGRPPSLPREPRLQRPTGGEQDRADEERDRVGSARRPAARSRGTGRPGSTWSQVRSTAPSSDDGSRSDPPVPDCLRARRVGCGYSTPMTIEGDRHAGRHTHPLPRPSLKR